MSLLSRIMRRRKKVTSGSFSVEVEMHRADEVRSWVKDAPSEDELEDRPHDPWRPARTLGPMPKR
jgi:hypothetical protein